MELKYEKKEVYEKLSENEKKVANEYAKSYIEFLDKAKTEYLCVEEVKEMLDKEGFIDIRKKESLKSGDKIYFVNKDKSMFIAVIGNQSLASGINIIGSHIDSPRLDLKPLPLYEKDGLALLKTQFYGGIKNYQWLSIPLAMHGVIYNENGERIKISIGDNDDEPCFTIADLLPHLAKDQMKQNANEFIDPEKMSILFGNIKDYDAKDNKIKSNVLKILNDKYGIKEIDFARSEISFVPAIKSRFVGIDKSMIGGYGQDDRICSYANVKAIIDITKEERFINKTMVAMLVDKEEIGSIGNTSMQSEIFSLFIRKLIERTGSTSVDEYEVYYNSRMLSADVSACVDPNYDDVSDIQNGHIVGCGVAIEKYTGGSGKYNSSDANAKFVAEVMNIFERNNVVFQIGVLGKQGKGGGGTIAYILANKGVDVIDCGTAVLAMHSPFEITSVYDTYMTYLAYKAFFKEN